MVEEEDEIEEVSDNSQQPPFTMVHSKVGKKQAKKSLTPNKPYGTRSRVGAPKPFK
jgi:hypothetical protein